jgi:hypothetical protein
MINKAKLVQHLKVTDELGNTIEIKLWQVPATPDKPHGFKYSLVYIVAGERVVGFDNAEGKGDHQHRPGREEPYCFTSLQQLTDDFWAAVKDYLGSLP